MDRSELERAGEWATRAAAEVVAEAARQLGELVPPESRAHLFKAQRELFLAALAAIEHRRGGAAKGHRRRPRKIHVD